MKASSGRVLLRIAGSVWQGGLVFGLAARWRCRPFCARKTTATMPTAQRMAGAG